jgi:hypothetical protein
MIKVYFQSLTGSHSELVATFQDDRLYVECLPALIVEARRQRCMVTETEINEDINDMVARDNQAVGYSCLIWSPEDFDGSHEKMTNFFDEHNESIIQKINELK